MDMSIEKVLADSNFVLIKNYVESGPVTPSWPEAFGQWYVRRAHAAAYVLSFQTEPSGILEENH